MAGKSQAVLCKLGANAMSIPALGHWRVDLS